MNDPINYGNAIKKLYEKTHASPEAIAKTLGIEPSLVRQHLNMPEPEKGVQGRMKKPPKTEKPKAPTPEVDELRQEELSRDRRSNQYSAPETFRQAVKEAAKQAVKDELGGPITKILKGSFRLGKQELIAAFARNIENNYGLTGEWLGSKIRKRTGLPQIGRYDPDHHPAMQDKPLPSDQETVKGIDVASQGMVDSLAKVGKSLETVLNKVDYGVKSSTQNIVRSIDRITSQVKGEELKKKEEEYEENRKAPEVRPESSMLGNIGLGIAGVGAGVAGASLLGGSEAQAAEAPGDALRREETSRESKSDTLTFEADTIEFVAETADMSKIFAGGSVFRGFGGTGGTPVSPDGVVGPELDAEGYPIGPGGRGVPERFRNGPRRRRGSGGGGGGARTYGPPTPGGEGYSGGGGHVGDMIGSGEGGYGSYNRGVAGDTKDKLDYQNLTVGELMRRQALPQGHPDRIFAAGKYQVIPGTMSEAVQALGLDPNQKFTPELQEKINREFLLDKKRPAVKDYVTGNGSLTDAQLALAAEFASVANPNTGVSNYGGVGGNKASISADRAADALKKEREQYKKNLAACMGEKEAWMALSPGGHPVKEKKDRVGGKTPSRLRPEVAGPINAGIMAMDDYGKDNLLLSQRTAEGAWPPPTPMPSDERFGGPVLRIPPPPPPPIADYVERRAQEHKLDQSRPQVIDAGPEPKGEKSSASPISHSWSDSEINGDPPETSKSDHFDDFLGIGVTTDPGLGK